MTRLALDTNLLVLLLVGKVGPQLVADGRHKRLKAYGIRDVDLLFSTVKDFTELFATPHAWTEVSNILEGGAFGSLRSQFLRAFAALIAEAQEIVVPTSMIAMQREFKFLGVADCAWICALPNDVAFLTADVALYQTALKRGLRAVNFTHLRVAAGTI